MTAEQRAAVAVKERPIIFSGSMVRAILEGRKTQTRRVCKGLGVYVESEMGMRPPMLFNELEWIWPDGTTLECQYGVPGDRLWVRETFGVAFSVCGADEVVYAADYPDDSDKAAGVVRRPSIHMPRWASRITLEIADVRVQRLNEISEADAIAEGISRDDYLSPVAGFIDLWHTIHASNGQHGWSANPWVWAISFRRIDATR